jgi:hypothetical protein
LADSLLCGSALLLCITASHTRFYRNRHPDRVQATRRASNAERKQQARAEALELAKEVEGKQQGPYGPGECAEEVRRVLAKQVRLIDGTTCTQGQMLHRMAAKGMLYIGGARKTRMKLEMVNVYQRQGMITFKYTSYVMLEMLNEYSASVTCATAGSSTQLIKQYYY